jgi:branched-chain amino acid transport system substrate-binding protein
MKRYLNFSIAIVMALCLGVFFFGCKEKKSETIKIGAILPLTGKFADAGNSVRVGIAIAAQELNETSDNKFEVIYYDTESEVKNATSGYTKLKSINKCEIFFTSMSDHCLALKPLAIKDSLLLFCIASHPDITKENHQLVFRPANTGIDEAIFMINYIRNNMPSSSIFVYSYNADAGIELEKKFKEELSDKVIGSCIYEEDLSSIKNITLSSRYKNAEVIIVIGFSPTMGSVIKSLRESGYKGDIIANAGFNNPSVLNVVGDYAKSVSYTDYDFPYTTTMHQVKDSISHADYKTSFSSLSYMSYVPMYIISNALKNGDFSTHSIGSFLSVEKEYNVNGAIFTTHEDGGITPGLKITKQ